MINIISELLSNIKFSIWVRENTYVIYSDAADCQENYVEIIEEENGFAVKEVHRAVKETVFISEDKEETVIMACVACMRLYNPLPINNLAYEIEELVKSEGMTGADNVLKSFLLAETFAIETEDYSKISIIVNGQNSDVKFHSKFLIQGVALPRAYFVLCNYSKKLEYIRGWYYKYIQNRWSDVDANKIEEIYIMGRYMNE